MPTPGNVEKLSITKSPSLKFCLNGLDTIGLDYFISVYAIKELYDVVLVF